MCVIACKYLKDIGWVGVKNRDRNYKPTISIKQITKNNIEMLYIVDSVTKYSEGINEYGISILNSATSVKNDESEGNLARRKLKNKKKIEGTYVAPDGIVVRKALNTKDINKTIKILIDNEFIGNTLIFNKEKCFLLESGRDKEDFEANMKASELDSEHEWTPIKYTYDLKEISHKDFVVRTNHGEFLDWLGYQKTSDDIKILQSRNSSETRHAVVCKEIKKAETIDDIIKAVSNTNNKNSQLNPIRLGDYNSKSKLKTTAQYVLVPSKKEMIYTPVWSYVDLSNYDKTNSNKTKTFLTVKSFNLAENNIRFKEFYEMSK